MAKEKEVKRSWRAGRLGWMSGLHSLPDHRYGTCWCQDITDIWEGQTMSLLDRIVTFLVSMWDKLTNKQYSWVCSYPGCGYRSSSNVFAIVAETSRRHRHIGDSHICRGGNSNICVAEGCFDESCLDLKDRGA